VIATEELAAILEPTPSDHSSMLAAASVDQHGGSPQSTGAASPEYLTPGFCEAARELNSLTGLAERITILHGSALEIPVSDASSDRAYSQAVLMNISDKLAFLREVFRVLRPGGLLALSFVFCGCAGRTAGM